MIDPADLAPPTFSGVALREGYSAHEVDRFVTELVRRLTTDPGAATAEWVDSVLFRPVRRQGYDMEEVDAWLASVAALLPRRSVPSTDVTAPAISGSALPEWLSPPRFRRTRWREGYAMAEVDRFVPELQRRAVAVSGAEVAQWVSRIRFTPVRVREGYDMGEVDEWLDQVCARLTG